MCRFQSQNLIGTNLQYVCTAYTKGVSNSSMQSDTDFASVTKQFHVINVQLDVIHPRLFSTLSLKTITQLYDVNYIMLRKYDLMVYQLIQCCTEQLPIRHFLLIPYDYSLQSMSGTSLEVQVSYGILPTMKCQLLSINVRYHTQKSQIHILQQVYMKL